MIKSTLATMMLMLTLATVSAQTESQEALDGPKRIFRDELLENLTGDWRITGKVMGRAVENTFRAEWILNHQFLQMHFKDVNNPPAYEALPTIGYDHTSGRYVMHWLDTFGGRWSETLGYGARSGDRIKFVFEYPDGPFHNTLIWQPATKTWRFLLERKNKAGEWTTFAEYDLRRAAR